MLNTILAHTLLAILQYAQVNALLRFPCSQLTVTRSDPLVNPGAVSAHLHQIVGGSAYVSSSDNGIFLTPISRSFDFSMPSNSTDMQKASCSTCSIKENKSNYRTPTLYFRSPANGTFKRVRQKPGPITGRPNAGMVVYYIQRGNVTSFPKGFRMLSGDPYLRAFNSSIDDSRSITFRCLRSPSDQSGGPDTNGMPPASCAGGVRTQINFPTCWDGKNIDSPNHKSHVAYAIGEAFGKRGSGCPASHPVNIPLLFLETYWDTAPYAKEWRDGKSPFVWSMGDPTGYGYHADYMMGWPEDVLQKAMSTCNSSGGAVSACRALTERTEQDMNDCAIPNRVEEDLDGWLDELPGCNKVYDGPDRAPYQSGCGAPSSMLPTTSVSFLTPSSKLSVPSWSPLGCAPEAGNATLLDGAKWTPGGQSMTIEKCIERCTTGAPGSKFIGLKAGTTCSCGNTFDMSKLKENIACNIACEGNLNQNCGAANRLAVYGLNQGL